MTSNRPPWEEPNIVALVPAVTAAEESRIAVIDVLNEIMEEAERGEVGEIVAMIRHPDGSYSERATPTDYQRDWIGQLEILKHSWINKIVRKYEED